MLEKINFLILWWVCGAIAIYVIMPCANTSEALEANKRVAKTKLFIMSFLGPILWLFIGVILCIFIKNFIKYWRDYE